LSDTEAFKIATDEVLAGIVKAASRRLVVVAPAVTSAVANAISERATALRADAITLILDSDPEVYRLGYGTLEGLQEIEKAAGNHGITIRRQPGVRIGLIIADDQTLIFTPTARLVEAGPNTQGGANAILLQGLPRNIESDLGFQGAGLPQVGRTPLSAGDVAAITGDLEMNPPQKFDLARKVRVFNAFIEFVELEVRGTEVSRRMVSIPSYLLAVVDAETRKQLRASFRLVPEGHSLSGSDIEKDRRLFVSQYVKVIPNYGTVVLRKDRPAFDAAVKTLEGAVKAFGERVKADIQQRIDENITELVKSLLPALIERTPQEWIPSTGEPPNKETIRARLTEDLRRAFGSAQSLVRDMSVRCRVKGVTYELLNDKVFLESAAKALPELERFHREFVTAEEVAGAPNDHRQQELRLGL
jgi:hypothetical protein